MLWNRRARGKLAGLTLLLILPALSLQQAERRLSVYSVAANYSLPIIQREGRSYVGLLELLDPLGTVSTKNDGQRWRLRFNNRVQAEFNVGKDRVRIQGRDINLGGDFLLENGRGLVPMSSLNAILPILIGGPANLHTTADRLFIGDAGTHFTATIPPAERPSLVLQFSGAVSPTVTTEVGGLRLTFSQDPVVSPASPTLTFGDKAIPSASFSEANGRAEIFIHSSNPLVATASRDGRTIIVTASNSPAQTAGSTISLVPSSPTPSPPPALPQAPTGNTATLPTPSATPQVYRRYVVVLDASHGGDDPGEAIGPSLLEKDITLSFSHRLREELEKQGITVFLLREGDNRLTADQRASLANTNHGALYLALHASSSGHGVRLFTALSPSYGEDRGPFRAWEAAQLPFRTYSLTAAAGISSALQQQQIPVRTLMAPQRPLGNITEAAIALEFAPQGTEAAQLASPNYQQSIANAVANGVASVRDKLVIVP